MIKTTKSTTINAISQTEDGKQIANFYASVSETGTTNNSSIISQDLYIANKDLVRTDKTEFDKVVYSVEDEAKEDDADVAKEGDN